MELHNGIKARDDISFSRLCDLYLEKIVQTLRRRRKYYKHFNNDESLAPTAVIDAFLSYNSNPDSFNPHKSTLEQFLNIAAEGDLKNALSKETKRTSRQKSDENVELREKFRNSIIERYSSADATIITEETMDAIHRILDRYFFTDTDIQLAKMVISKERATDEYSKVLGLGLLSLEEQRSEVNRNKDRIKKVVQRNDIESKIKSLLQ